MARSKKNGTSQPTRKPISNGRKNRVDYPYVVFQVEQSLKNKLDRKILQLKRQGKPNASMSAFVEHLIRRAV